MGQQSREQINHYLLNEKGQRERTASKARGDTHEGDYQELNTIMA